MDILLNFFTAPRLDEWWIYILLIGAFFFFIHFICYHLFVNVLSKPVHPEPAGILGTITALIITQTGLLSIVGIHFYREYGAVSPFFYNNSTHLGATLIFLIASFIFRFRLNRMLT